MNSTRLRTIAVPISTGGLLLCLLSAASCRYKAEPADSHHTGQVYVRSVPFRSGAGWGYAIYAGDSVYIRQSFIPGLPGKHPFVSREDAGKTGNLVIERMSVLHRMPRITTEDLQQLQIHLPE